MSQNHLVMLSKFSIENRIFDHLGINDLIDDFASLKAKEKYNIFNSILKTIIIIIFLDFLKYVLFNNYCQCY